jgi:anti-sigma regulatory factor (Ser/Thr protein kinase)
MDNTCFSLYKIEDASYSSFIKREIHNILTQRGFTPHRTGEIDIIISELTSNLVKHAKGGELYYLAGEENSNKYLEVFAVDSGPGTNDIKRFMKDGQSTVNTLGQGLGSINRLSNTFQIYSMKGWGTVAYSKSYLNKLPPKSKMDKVDILLGAMQVAVPGEIKCGDGYQVKKKGDNTLIFMGDGLGHGPFAYEAVQTAIEAFNKCDEITPSEILRYIHSCVRKTRGLVASIAVLNSKQKTWTICGIGNITTRIFEGIVSKGYMAYNGILGHNIPRNLTDSVGRAENFQCLIMYSDGLRSRWEASKYPGLLQYDPAIIAGVIYKENARKNDDMTVLVGKVSL